MMARLQDFLLPQRGAVSRDKKLARMLDRVGALLDEADAIVARATPDDPPEDAPPTPVEQLGDLLAAIRAEIGEYRYPDWWSERSPATRRKIDRAAGLRLAGLSWSDIEEDFRYRGEPFTLGGELHELIERRVKQLEPVKELLWQYFREIDDAKP